MLPELFSIGSFTVTSFGVLMGAAFLAGYATTRAETVRLGAGPDMAGDLLVGALVGGVLGAKLYYVLLNWDLTALDPLGMIFSRSGLVWYGGLIGGFLGAAWAVRRHSVTLGMDAIAPGLALGYGIGRLGCFMVGDDYGRPVEWGIAFPNGAPPSTAGNLRAFGVDVPASVPDATLLAVHPTQLYEAGLSLLIFLLLWRARAHSHQRGWLFGVWLALAAAERFAVEFFRAKDDRFLGDFTIAQAISVVLIAAGAWWAAKRR